MIHFFDEVNSTFYAALCASTLMAPILPSFRHIYRAFSYLSCTLYIKGWAFSLDCI